ncbi:MAG: hypothetical protein MJA82_15130 [Clostridia bacterium]|nr:hypothetical protein [Clostridia bacterium]
MAMLAVHFFKSGSRINNITIKPGMYHKNSAKLVPNCKNIVNKLWVKGGKSLSEVYTQDIAVEGSKPIQLFYSPQSPITVTINGQSKNFGIQNIHESGKFDFLINVSEKLLIPDLCQSGSGTISYRYKYPIKILLEEPKSQEKYGVFEDILNVDTGDKELALEFGFKHLIKYSQPVISGSIKPFRGVFRAGEIIKVEIPQINIDHQFQIKDAQYESTPMKPTYITLQLETPEKDLSNILKDMSKRIEKLEKEAYKDDEGPVEKYIAKEELLYWHENNDVVKPIEALEWTFWKEESIKARPYEIDESVSLFEEIENNIHFLITPSYSLYPSETLYP